MKHFDLSKDMQGDDFLEPLEMVNEEDVLQSVTFNFDKTFDFGEVDQENEGKLINKQFFISLKFVLIQLQLPSKSESNSYTSTYYLDGVFSPPLPAGHRKIPWLHGPLPCMGSFLRSIY